MAEVIPLRPLPDAVEVPGIFQPDQPIAELINGGEHLLHDPVFEDDEWEMAGHPCWRDKAGTQTRIKFNGLDPRWRKAAKELALLQMNPGLAPTLVPDNAVAQAWPQLQEAIAPVTSQGNTKMLSHALATIDAHRVDFAEPEAWERMKVLLPQPASVEEKQAGATLAGTTVRGRAQQLVALWQATQISGRHDLLGVHRPWGGQPVTDVFAKGSKFNQVRPHEDMGNVLGFVAWFFDNIAENIVEHVEWWTSNVSQDPAYSNEVAAEEMRELLLDLAAKNDNALPASHNVSGGTSLAAAPLARLIGIYDADEAYTIGRSAFLKMHPKPRLVVGVTPCPVPIVEVPDADGVLVPWTHSLLPAKNELDVWQRRLVYYAMYYLAATVMLRDSQLATLPIDPVKTEEITRPSGVTYIKHTLSAFKTKNRHAPVPTQVTANGRIARIVELLHRLQQALQYEPARSPATGLPFLFDQRLGTPVGKPVHGLSRDGLYLDQAFLLNMKNGARELHRRGVIRRDLDDVKLSMRQVRITCAQAYAVREHGQALAAAFGQWDTSTVARGYVGDVFRLITPIDPEETREFAREDIGRRLVDAAEHRGDPTGNGLRRMEETVTRNRKALSNPQPLTPARLRALGKNNPNIEQGPLTLCIFQAEGALCGGKGKPDFRLCLPGQCRNSVMSQADRARYELMRRQHLELSSPVLRRAADRMHDANPAIAEEFAELSDDEVAGIVKDHVDDYIRRALEGRP